MRRIVTAITGTALALSMMVALAAPARAAVTGYDSAYAGESAFLTLSPGQSGSFTVFFLNTGTTTWTKGTATQVDLAACLDDKVTCNAQDASEAGYNSGWLSATRYATTTQTSVSPGQVATFTYNVAVPAGEASALHHFNGALVLSSTGADIHNEGYYQDVNVTAPSAAAATLVSLSPITGSTAGGTTVTATGTGFVCTPSFPTVTVDTTAVTPTACGSTSLTFKTPAHAAGGVNVTVTNAGAPASNALLFTYKAPAPNLTAIQPFAGTSLIKATFDQPVCVAADNAGTLTLGGVDISATQNGGTAAIANISFNATTGSGNCGTGSTTGSAATSDNTATSTLWVRLTPTLTAGDSVTLTVTTTGAAKVQNTDGTAMPNAETVAAAAAADSSTPSMSSAKATATSKIKVSYSDRVTCNGLGFAQFVATIGSSAFTGTALTCTTNAGDAFGSTSVTVTFGTNDVTAGGFITYTQSSTSADRIKSITGNNATSPQTVSVTSLPVSTTRPQITAVTRTPATGSSASTLGAGDKFVITFNAAMDTTTGTTTPGLRAQGAAEQNTAPNQDIITLTCGQAATCSWNSAGTTVTVTVTDAVSACADNGTTFTGCQLPETIIDSTFKDSSGNLVDLSNKPALPQ